MIASVLILTFSVALFFFYIQAFCERALKREFSHPYFQDIINAIQLEFPRLQDGFAANGSLDYSEVRSALKCDFTTLSYLLANSDRTHQRLSWKERVLVLYFRFLLFCLPFRYTFNLHQQEAVLKLTAILQYFANLTGEKVSVGSLGSALPDPQS